MIVRRALLFLPLVLASAHAASATDDSFAAFLSALWPDAAKTGIARTTFDLAFAGLTPDAGVLGAMRREPEYGKPFGAYLASLVSPSRIGVGIRKSAQWAPTLRAVQEKFGVEPGILVAIWGVESSFGDG